MYTVGIDFGTLSGRALLVDVRDGREVASVALDYPSGVMDEQLAVTGSPLPPQWALQDPDDYLEVVRRTVPAVLKEAGVDASEVVGVGIDFTASTTLPTKADGTPLSSLPEFRQEPHAWVKLWKHHAAQPQADRLNAVAAERGETWLPYYGGKYSSEWLFSKSLQVLEEAPEVYAATDRFVEAADWVVWQLTGVESRNACTAGYKAMVQGGEYPSRDYFVAVNPAFGDVLDKLGTEFAELGARAGGLTQEWATATGLAQGTAVAVANVDAHVTAPAVKATQPGAMVMIMGTSTCHILSGSELRMVEGMCGVVRNGIIPGYYGYEAGQSGVGDIFAWFVDNMVPARYFEAAEAAGVSVHTLLEREAAQQRVGAHGLLALDWWNGNRSTLVNADLTGLLVGMTLATRAPDVYRALIESTAYGTRKIIEAFEESGVEVRELIAAGGLPAKNALLCQIYADVTGRPLRLAGSDQSPALGAAIHAAVAAGVHHNVQVAAEKMGKLQPEAVLPIAENSAVYDRLYRQYERLYDELGAPGDSLMAELKAVRDAALGVGVGGEQ